MEQLIRAIPRVVFAVSLTGFCALLNARDIESQVLDPHLILQQVRAATGADAWARVTSLHTHATLISGGRQGVLDTYEDVRAGRFVREVSLPTGQRADGFDGISVWTQPARIRAYVKGDADSRLGAVSESFRVERGWWFPERGPASSEYAGTQRDNQSTFDLVRITPEGGRPFTLWVDRGSHLIDRVVEQQAEGVSIVRYSDYRWVGGVRLPFSIRRDDEYTADEIQTVLTVEVDPEIADRRFSVPDAPGVGAPDAPSSGGGMSRTTAPAPLVAGAASPVTVPFRLENGKILVEVSINGKGPYEAEFDSGGNLLIQPAVVAELGLTAGGAVKLTGGGEGSITAQDGVVETLLIGGASIDHARFSSFPWNDRYPRRVLFGLEVLQRYVVRVDFDAMTLTLVRPEQFEYSGAGAIVPFHFQDNQPEVYGAVDGISGVFSIDTGGSGSLLLIAPFARRYGLVERYRAVIPYGGRAVTATHGVYCRVGEVTLNGADGRAAVSVSRPVSRISLQQAGYDADRYVSGNIEIGILKQFNVTFDYARQRLIFERSHHYGEPDVFNRSGMRLDSDRAGWRVAEVYPEGPAEKAGVHPGDLVVAIDGKAWTVLDRAAIHDIMVGPVGSTVRLTIRSGHVAGADRAATEDHASVADHGSRSEPAVREVGLILRDVL